MSLGWNLNVRAKVRHSVSLAHKSWIFWALLSSAHGAHAAYSPSELRAAESPNETRIRTLQQEEINQLRMTLGRRAAANRKADLYYRLAELYMETYHSAFLLEGKVHEQRLAQGQRDSVIDRSYSRPFLHAGIKACQEIIDYKLNYSKLDEIYYFLGFYYAELDQRSQSEKAFAFLVKNFRQSPYLGAAYKELGNYAMMASQFGPAVSYLEKSTQTLPEDAVPPVQHKLAWAYYRTRQYDQAVSAMKQVIALSQKFKEKYAPLREQSLKDLATFLVERGQVEEALRYFKEVAGNDTLFPQILEKLGAQYERNVELPKAIAVYDRLLQSHPESAAALRVSIKLVELDIRRGAFKEAIARLGGIDFSKAIRLQKETSQEAQDTRESIQNLKVSIRKTATHYHEASRKKKDPMDLERAELFYFAYLNSFLKQEDPHRETNEIKMYLAEVQLDRGKRREAAELYRQIVQSKDPRYAEVAGGLWLSSLSEAIQAEARGSAHSATRGATSAPGERPSELESQYVEAVDFYCASLGPALQTSHSKENHSRERHARDAKIRELTLHSARILAGYKTTQGQAIQRIIQVIDHWPSSSSALTAAQLWLQLVNGQEEGLASAIQTIRGNHALLEWDRKSNQGKIQNYLVQLDKQQKVTQIARREKTRDFKGAAQGYEEFADSASDRESAERAYASALASAAKDESSNSGLDSSGLLRVMQKWSKRFPKSPKAIDPLRNLATDALIQGDFHLSAQVFEVLGAQYSDRDALETAGRIFAGHSEDSAAQRVWQTYLNLYPPFPQRGKIALILAQSQELGGDDRGASRSYRVCLEGSSPWSAECGARLADLYVRNRDLEQAHRYYALASAPAVGKGGGPKAGPVSPFVGYAKFQFLKLNENKTPLEPLRLPESQLQKALTQRLNYLEPLARSYNAVVKAGGPWAIAALHRLAQFAQQFAEELDAIEPPEGASPRALEKFRKDLQSVSGPLRDKARATWNEAYSQATTLNLFSSSLPDVADALANFGVGVPGRAQGPWRSLCLAESGSSGQVPCVVLQPTAGEAQKVRARLRDRLQDPDAWTAYGNVLYFNEQPGLARLVYERALAISPQHPAALNNLAVVKVSEKGPENWLNVNESALILEKALKKDDFFAPAKVNLGTLLNYYRMFPKAKSLWEQVSLRSREARVSEGLAVALQGSGQVPAAVARFGELATQANRNSGGNQISLLFSLPYHEAARQSARGKEGAEECLRILNKMNPPDFKVKDAPDSFMTLAIEHLKEKCELWKKTK